MTRGPSERHGRRLERVVRRLVEHRGDAPDLDALAALGCLSRFHFQRVYRRSLGETPAATLRRLRLHLAASALLRGDRPVAVLAREAGYGSVAAFSRAFRAAYGTAPATFRRRGGLAAPSSPSAGERAMHEVTIVAEPALRLAAIAHRGPYPKIGHAFERLRAWAATRGLMAGPHRMLAVFHDDPAKVEARALRSHAGLVLAGPVALDGEVEALTLAGGRHARLVHEGPYAALDHAWRALVQGWLPLSGETAAARPCYEDYLNDPHRTPPARLRRIG